MLNENRLVKSDFDALQQIRSIAEANPSWTDQKNAVHFLAVETGQLHQLGLTNNLSQLYRLWFVEAGKVRAKYKHEIRWFRADWYGQASDPYYTPFKRFAQSVNPKFDSRKDSQKMSIALSELVAKRVIDYRDLMLQDNTRQRKQNTVKGWNGILLAIEKDAMWNQQLTDFTENLGMLVVTSGKGEPSRNSNEMVYRIVERSGLKECVLLSITDYDKYGFYIENSFKEHLQTYGIVVNHRRVGTFPEFYTSEELTPEACLYELPSAWEHAIDGKYGIEMDTKEWKFYFRKILEKLIEMGYTIEDFDEWARRYKWARDYRAREDAIDTIVGNIDYYQAWLKQKERIAYLIDKLRKKIDDQLRPEVEPITSEENFDDRKDETDKFIDDLVNLKRYEDRYSSTYLTEKLQTNLEGWFEDKGEIPEKSEIEGEIE